MAAAGPPLLFVRLTLPPRGGEWRTAVDSTKTGTLFNEDLGLAVVAPAVVLTESFIRPRMSLERKGWLEIICRMR